MSMEPSAGASRKAFVLATIGAGVFGALNAVQSRINGELSRELDDGFFAAMVSFGSGLVLVFLITVLAPSGRRALSRIRAAVGSRDIPWWYLFGGLAGAAFVLAQGITAPLLGVALLTIATVTGQTLSGLVVDKTGMGTMSSKPLTAGRLVGSILTVVAVAVTVSAQLEVDFPFWALVLPFVAGLGASWQQAANGQLRAVGGSAFAATFANFLIGTVALGVALAVHAAIDGWPAQLPSNPVLYVGGALGVLFIAGFAVVVKYIGALLLGLCAVAGQLVASLLLDVFAPVADRPLGIWTVIGTALTLVAVVIAAIPARARGRR
jgi:transporter family-2 protein